MDTKKLRRLAQDFLVEAGRLRDVCETEEDYEDVCEVIQDVVEGLPRVFVILDYYMRNDIKNNIPSEPNDPILEDSQFINKLIDILDISFYYDDINDYIMTTAEELEEKQNENEKIQQD